VPLQEDFFLTDKGWGHCGQSAAPFFTEKRKVGEKEQQRRGGSRKKALILIPESSSLYEENRVAVSAWMIKRAVTTGKGHGPREGPTHLSA